MRLSAFIISAFFLLQKYFWIESESSTNVAIHQKYNITEDLHLDV